MILRRFLAYLLWDLKTKICRQERPCETFERFLTTTSAWSSDHWDTWIYGLNEHEPPTAKILGCFASWNVSVTLRELKTSSTKIQPYSNLSCWGQRIFVVFLHKACVGERITKKKVAVNSKGITSFTKNDSILRAINFRLFFFNLRNLLPVMNLNTFVNKGFSSERWELGCT